MKGKEHSQNRIRAFFSKNLLLSLYKMFKNILLRLQGVTKYLFESLTHSPVYFANQDVLIPLLRLASPPLEDPDRRDTQSRPPTLKQELRAQGY